MIINSALSVDFLIIFGKTDTPYLESKSTGCACCSHDKVFYFSKTTVGFDNTYIHFTECYIRKIAYYKFSYLVSLPVSPNKVYIFDPITNNYKSISDDI